MVWLVGWKIVLTFLSFAYAPSVAVDVNIALYLTIISYFFRLLFHVHHRPCLMGNSIGYPIVAIVGKERVVSGHSARQTCGHLAFSSAFEHSFNS